MACQLSNSLLFLRPLANIPASETDFYIALDHGAGHANYFSLAGLACHLFFGWQFYCYAPHQSE